jgi:carboxypeptidase Q
LAAYNFQATNIHCAVLPSPSMWKRLLLAGITGISLLPAQMPDSLQVRAIFDVSLVEAQAYLRLGELCKTIGHRLSGSTQAEQAVAWALNMLRSYPFDTVFTQDVMVPHWERSNTEALYLRSSVLSRALKSGQGTRNYQCEALEDQGLKAAKEYRLSAVALGGSVGTGGRISGNLVVVNSPAELDSLGKSGLLTGRFVLFNRAFDERNINTFASYGACVGQRVKGASEAAVYGAAAVLVRSMTNRCDLHPHTGVMIYNADVPQIPAVAVASAVANLLEKLVVVDAHAMLSLNLGCRTLPDAPSHNVIAAVTGTVFPNKIIAFGGHFDSWDQGEGAHDDGAGCMHAFDALRILQKVGYQPRHTLRCVWWMNEENGLRGASEYARLALQNGEVHVAALESDRGGFTPRGFGVDTLILSKLLPYSRLLQPYGAGTFEAGGGGADIGPLKRDNPATALVSFVPDSQRYFDVHHAETDVFENVNRRELQLGAAAIAVMIWMLDQALD